MAFHTEKITEELKSEIKGYVLKLHGSMPPRNSFSCWAIDTTLNAKMFFADDMNGDGYCLAWGDKIIGVDITTQKPSLDFSTDMKVRISPTKYTFAKIRGASNFSSSEIDTIRLLVKEAIRVLDTNLPTEIVFTDERNFHLANPFDWFDAAKTLARIIFLLLLMIVLPVASLGVIVLTLLKWLGLTTYSAM